MGITDNDRIKMPSRRVIGITGGVGSGKSTVLQMLKQHYRVFICMADELGHEAMKKGTDACAQIIARFGKTVELPDGGIDRNALADIVYREDECLNALNGIIHPFVHREIRRQIDGCPAGRVFVLETAILFESGCETLCDEVWGVITDDEIRIRRLMESRGYSRDRATGIMRRQMSNQELAERCDCLIANDGDMEELLRQIHRHMLRESSDKFTGLRCAETVRRNED